MLMGEQYTAKSFKSGNSVAIRMPAALGVRPDKDWIVEERGGEFVIRERGAPKRKFNIEKVRGCAIGSGLRFIKHEDRVFEERSLVWDDPEWRAKYMPGE
jgi:antitoxin VapB